MVCLDVRERVLLLHWQDPWDGDLLWEPPGGGIDPGETAFEAARRELTEETGLDCAAVVDRPVEVERSTKWNGKLYVGPEPFYLARYVVEAPALSRLGLLEYERRDLRGHAWLSVAELATLPDRLEPPDLADIIAALTAG